MDLKKFALSLLIVGGASWCQAQIKLPKLISDGMIMQQQIPAKVWGWAAPNEKVNLQFNGKNYQTIADNIGNWSIKLPATNAGGPYQLVFKASNRVTVNDVLFGDVWVCSGQSNMELPMGRLIDKYPNVISAANNSNIRQFLVPDEYDFNQKRNDLSAGTWIKAGPQSILDFSGAAYFFALEMYAKSKVPLGIINTALGGSPAEAWISEEGIKKFPTYAAEAAKFKDKSLIKTIESKDLVASREWQNRLNEADLGIKNNWKAENLAESDWQKMMIPGYWAEQHLGPINGSVWFRKEVTIPKEMIGKSAKLLMGRIVDADSVFLNGQLVGTTSYQYPPRRYILPAGLLKEGKNTLAIKVINNSGKGGFIPDKPYQISAGNDIVDLKGEWSYKLGAKMSPAPGQTFIRWKPIGLYNAMISPLTNFAIKGALWYQGESNTANPNEYTALMTTLISDWRKAWGLGNFPFIYVQLPGFMEDSSMPSESNWAQLRQQQLMLQEVPNTAMAIAIDLGEWNDIHPLNKQDVGKRLALQAQRLTSGVKGEVSSGPIFRTVYLANQQLVLSFTNVGGGLKSKDGGALQHFAIAGKDKKFVWAKAKIVGNEVRVWSDEITNPVYVRYAWANNPVKANLYNKAGLPASPFEGSLK